jgi:hypothetical protein
MPAYIDSFYHIIPFSNKLFFLLHPFDSAYNYIISFASANMAIAGCDLLIPAEEVN